MLYVRGQPRPTTNHLFYAQAKTHYVSDYCARFSFVQVWQKTTKSAVSGRSAKIGDLLKNTGATIVSGEGNTPGKRALANAEMMHQVGFSPR